jgi:hypothetical protein
MFVRLCVSVLCCVVLGTYRPLRHADHSYKGVLPSALLLRHLQCEAAKVLTRTVELMLMMMIMMVTTTTVFDRLSHLIHHDFFCEYLSEFSSQNPYYICCTERVSVPCGNVCGWSETTAV